MFSFSEALWAENRRYDIRVLAVCPESTDTKFFQEANFPQLAKQAAQHYTPKEVVVRETLAALEKEKHNIVPGGVSNQILANLFRFLPRDTVVSLIEPYFKK